LPVRRKTIFLHLAKNLIKISIAASLILATLLACNHDLTQMIRYGVKIQYSQGEPLNFQDVTLEFIGITESPPSDLYPRSMYSYDFNVYSGSQALMISWSSGTGDIGPTIFELDGHRYALELAMSDKLGTLETNELVLWRIDD
jgi:hypothetical protein